MVGTTGTLIADGHVHIYRHFDLDTVLTAAVRNLRALASGSGADSGAIQLCLIVADTWTDRAFERIAGGESRLPAAWQLRECPGRPAIVLQRADGEQLVVIAGRQLVTHERLEVLAIGTRDTIPDGLSLAEAIAETRRAGAFPVIPWGFGKWWGRRGKLVRTTIEQESPDTIALGDSGGRLSIAGRPELLAVAERRGITVVAGSDPLPFPQQAARIGSFGFLLSGWDLAADPVQQITYRLAGQSQRPRIAGRLTGPLDFVAAQTRMQLLAWANG